MHESTFSLQYGRLNWTYIMFARGDFSTWVVYDRATWEALVSQAISAGTESTYMHSAPGD